MLNPKDHVVKRGSSDSFYCDFYTSPVDGGRPQRVFRSLKTTNKAEAIEKCARVIGEYYSKSAEGIRTENNLTLETLFDMFLETKKASTIHTHRYYQSGKVSARHFFGDNFLVRDLDVPKMSRYNIWLAEKGKAPDTVKHYLSALKMAVNWAWQSEIIKKNPVKLFKLPKGSGDRLIWFSPTQLDNVLSNLEEPSYGLVLALAHTGARKSSVLKMEWNWIDFDKEIIEFPSTIIKTRVCVRVPLSNILCEYLRKKKAEMMKNGADPKYVFSRNNGKTHVKDLRHHYKGVLKSLGLKGNVHSLRHSFATNYLEHNPGDLKGLTQLLGWRDTQMVMKYAHITQRQFEGQRAVINSMFKRPEDTDNNSPENVTKLVTNVVTPD
ncbi:MAG: site-specific integrase, partial [Alphaproteobacteria bacterium]|nr:site-specific integrase [Alphaproteobacteria bacterium]